MTDHCPFPWPCACTTGTPDLPDDLPLIERHAVRVVLRTRSGDVLLFRARERTLPELGFWWELPGGGLEAGETYEHAAVRELAEETGIEITGAQLGPPAWRRSVTYRHRGARRLQHEVVVTATVPGPRPAIDTSRQLAHELEDYVGFRWFRVPDLTGSRERFFPGRLAVVLPRLLAGGAIDEPLERWS